MVLVILLELVVDLLDVVQLPGNALEVVKVNDSVLAGGPHALRLKRGLIVGNGTSGEHLHQAGVCTTSSDSATTVLIDIFENFCQPFSHGSTQIVLLMGTLSRNVGALSVAVHPPVAAFLANIGIACINLCSVSGLELVSRTGVAISQFVEVFVHLERVAKLVQAFSFGESARIVLDLLHGTLSMEDIGFPGSFISR